MTIDKIVIKVACPGEKLGFESFDVEMKLNDLIQCMNYRTTASGEYDPKGSYPKGLWLFIEGWLDGLKKDKNK